jgi:hypothetical protein
MCFEHSGDNDEFSTHFLSHTDEFCKDETRVYVYNPCIFVKFH